MLATPIRHIYEGSIENSITPQNETITSHPMANDVGDDSSLRRLESRRFSYKELEMITNNFQQVLGQGGFGYVYSGFLEDGTQVAVKLRSHSSSQGVKEFLAEVKFPITTLDVSGFKRSQIKIIFKHCTGADFDTYSSYESCHHDWLLHGWGVHGPCLRVYVGRNLARAY
jgi:hypothetical protein